MPQYTVPQFIEHKAKIVGPLTFQQFIYVGIGGALCFFLYFTISFYLFILASILIMLIASALAFGQLGGRPLPEALKNFFFFHSSPKIYLWKRKVSAPAKLLQEAVQPEEKAEKMPVPAAVGKSRLKDLSTHIETKG